MLCYNTVLDITLITAGPQLVILDYFCYMSIDTLYSRYKKDWIANSDLDPNNSVIKRLWCINIVLAVFMRKPKLCMY